MINTELEELATVRIGRETVAYRTCEPDPDGAYTRRAMNLAVVFIHGMGNSSAVWGPVHSDLAAAGVRAFAVDIPGHGESTLRPRTPNFTEMAQTLADFVGQLGQRRIVIVGHSLGAVFALDLAVRLSERVAGLLLLAGPPLDMMDFYAHPLKAAVGKPRVLKQFTLLLLAGLPGAGPASEAGRRALAVVRGLGADRESEEPEPDARTAFALQHLGSGRILATTLGGFGMNYRESYRSIRQPCVAVLGGNDSLTNPAEIAEYLDSFPGPTSIEVWRDVGHMPMLENVDRTVAAVLRLVDQTAAQDP